MNAVPPVDPRTTLQTANGLLQRGHYAQGRKLITELLRAAPDQSDAHRMLVDSFLRTGEIANALPALDAWLAQQPGNLDAWLLLVRTQSAREHYVEAATALARAFDLAPTDPAVAAAIARLVALARTWLTLGRNEQALACVAPVAASAHADGTILMLYGHALMALGRKDEAGTAFRRWVAKEPANRDAGLRLAAVLADTGRGAEAEATLRKAIAGHGADPQSAFVLGRALLAQGRFDEAETEFRKVVQARPDHQMAHANLMELVWMRSGDVHQASRAIDRVLRAQPQLLGLRITKARLLTSARLPREALDAIDAGLALEPADAALLAAAAGIALDIDGMRALDYARRLAEVAPGNRAARVVLGNASLATGRARDALAVAESLCLAYPTDGQAIAMKADALRMLGDPRYRELLDYTHFVRADLLDVPAGWPDLASYVADLAAELTVAHTLKAHPIGNSLRHGSQVEISPASASQPAIHAFAAAIDGPIRRYIAAIGSGSDPMRSRNAGSYSISGMWSVRLRPNGFHVNHYHPEGWMSSACYLHLPGAVAKPGGEGWLKFGEPAFPTSPVLAPEFYLKPEPGLLALFPSYMWHGTVPFSGTEGENRITIAFDVVPAA